MKSCGSVQEIGPQRSVNNANLDIGHQAGAAVEGVIQVVEVERFEVCPADLHLVVVPGTMY